MQRSTAGPTDPNWSSSSSQVRPVQTNHPREFAATQTAPAYWPSQSPMGVPQAGYRSDDPQQNAHGHMNTKQTGQHGHASPAHVVTASMQLQSCCMGGPLGPHSMPFSHLAAVLHKVAEPSWSAIQGPPLSKVQQICQGDSLLQLVQPASAAVMGTHEPVVILDINSLLRGAATAGPVGVPVPPHPAPRISSSEVAAPWPGHMQQQQQQHLMMQQAPPAAMQWQQQQPQQPVMLAGVGAGLMPAAMPGAASHVAPMTYHGPMVPAAAPPAHPKHPRVRRSLSSEAVAAGRDSTDKAGADKAGADKAGADKAGADKGSAGHHNTNTRGHRFPPGYIPDVVRLRILAHAAYCSPPSSGNWGGDPEAQGSHAADDGSQAGSMVVLRRLAACYLAGCVRGPLGPHSLKGSLLAEVLAKSAPHAWSLMDGQPRLRALQDACLQVVPRAGNMVVRLDIDALEQTANHAASTILPLPPWFTSTHSAKPGRRGEHGEEEEEGDTEEGPASLPTLPTQAQAVCVVDEGPDSRAAVAAAPGPSALPAAGAPLPPAAAATCTLTTTPDDTLASVLAMAEAVFSGPDPASMLRRAAIKHVLSMPPPAGSTMPILSIRAADLAHVFRSEAGEAWAALPTPTPGTSKIAVLFDDVQGLWHEASDPTSITVGVDLLNLRKAFAAAAAHTHKGTHASPAHSAGQSHVHIKERLHTSSTPASTESISSRSQALPLVRGPPSQPHVQHATQHGTVQSAVAGALAHAQQGSLPQGPSGTVLVGTGSGTHALVHAPAEIAGPSSVMMPGAGAGGSKVPQPPSPPRTPLSIADLQVLGRIAFAKNELADVLRLAALNQLSLLQGQAPPLGPLTAPLATLVGMLKRLHPAEMEAAGNMAAEMGIHGGGRASRASCSHAALESALLSVPCFARVPSPPPSHETCIRLLPTELLVFAANEAAANLQGAAGAVGAPGGGAHPQAPLTHTAAAALMRALQQQQQQAVAVQQHGALGHTASEGAVAVAAAAAAAINAAVVAARGGHPAHALQALQHAQQQLPGAQGGKGTGRPEAGDEEGLALVGACVAVWWPHDPAMLAAAVGIVGQGPYWANRNGGRHRLPADIVRTAVAAALRRTGNLTSGGGGAALGSTATINRQAADAAAQDALSQEPLLTVDSAGCMVLPVHKLAETALKAIESRGSEAGREGRNAGWPPSVAGLAHCGFLPKQAQGLVQAFAELVEGPSVADSTAAAGTDAAHAFCMPTGQEREALLARCLALLKGWARGGALASQTSSSPACAHASPTRTQAPPGHGGATPAPPPRMGHGPMGPMQSASMTSLPSNAAPMTWQQQEFVRPVSHSESQFHAPGFADRAWHDGHDGMSPTPSWGVGVTSATSLTVSGEGFSQVSHHSGPAIMWRPGPGGARVHEEVMHRASVIMDDEVQVQDLSGPEEDEEGLALCAAALAVWWPHAWPLCAASIAMFCQSAWAVHHNGGRHRAQMVFVLREMSACQARPGAPMQHASHVAAKPLLVGEPFMAVASGGVPPVNTPHTADATQVVELHVVDLARLVVSKAAGTSEPGARPVVWPPVADGLVVGSLHHLSHPLMARFMARYARGGAFRSTLVARSLAVLQRIAAAGVYPLPGTLPGPHPQHHHYHRAYDHGSGSGNGGRSDRARSSSAFDGPGQGPVPGGGWREREHSHPALRGYGRADDPVSAPNLVSAPASGDHAGPGLPLVSVVEGGYMGGNGADVGGDGGAGVVSDGEREGCEGEGEEGGLTWQTLQETLAVQPGSKWADMEEDEEGAGSAGSVVGDGVVGGACGVAGEEGALGGVPLGVAQIRVVPDYGGAGFGAPLVATAGAVGGAKDGEDGDVEEEDGYFTGDEEGVLAAHSGSSTMASVHTLPCSPPPYGNGGAAGVPPVEVVEVDEEEVVVSDLN